MTVTMNFLKLTISVANKDDYNSLTSEFILAKYLTTSILLNQVVPACGWCTPGFLKSLSMCKCMGVCVWVCVRPQGHK